MPTELYETAEDILRELYDKAEWFTSAIELPIELDGEELEERVARALNRAAPGDDASPS